ncbi:MAG: FtsK/SpoIIIE domain-containing protein [Candidatus ainarchaeum sp.]|nr:FtsK/SpoIIIE domain-containing protein [Candidatus ainarchaeum sp.]
MYFHVFKPRSSPVHGNRPGKPIRVGRWGLLFFVFYAVSIILLFIFSPTPAIQPSMCLCFPIFLIIAIIPAILLTALSWLLWHASSHFYSSQGLQVAQELGRFEHTDDGWKFSRYIAGRKITLDTKSSSPHILVIGGSQTGKSSTVKTLLLKLLGNTSSSDALRLLLLSTVPHLIPLVVFFVLVAMLITPIMLVIYLLQFGPMTQTDVYAGWVLDIVVSLAISGWLWLYLRNHYKAVTKEGRGNAILDYHGEYRFLTDHGFVVVDARDYNPLAPNYPDEKVENIVSDFVDAFLVAFEATGEVQLAILKNKLEEYQNQAAALASIDRDAATAKSFTDKDRLTGLSLRLEKLARYAEGINALWQFTKGNRNVIFDFSGIRDRDAADFYAESILRRYLALLIEARQPTNIVIDEAHRLNTRFLSEKGCETSTVRIARESGKFDGRLIVASQNLTDFPPGFSANFGNIICFRTPSGADMAVLERMTGIVPGLLQSVMNGLRKGEALLIGPHNHYSIIKITLAGEFPRPQSNLPSKTKEPEISPLEVLDGAPVIPHVPQKEKILQLLKETGALTTTTIHLKLNCTPRHAWMYLQGLIKEGKVIQYEPVEIPYGVEIFYELPSPSRQETSFHKILIEKTCNELNKIGSVKILNSWGNPDLIFNEKIAIEVETGVSKLDQFLSQVRKRFAQGYGAVIVVVINKKQKKRYETALAGLKNVVVVTLRSLSKTAANAKI